MGSLLKFTIDNQNAGERLDKFLTAKMNGYTRSQIQKIITQGQVLINGKKPTKHHFLRTGDQILLDKEKKSTATVVPNLPKIKIIEANGDYFIVDKPAGLVVHPDQAHSLANSLVGQLLETYPEIKAVGEDPNRPGIVHRLDKDVSGVMVVARNQKSFDHLKNQFMKRHVKKEYYALVHGSIDKEQIKINFPIIRKKSGFMAALALGRQGRRSETILNVLNKYKKYTLISVSLITGRTHQIKVHLKAYNHPIVGEQTYTTKSYKNDLLQNTLNRPFLHAYQLKFRNLIKQEVSYQSKLPTDLQNIVKQLT